MSETVLILTNDIGGLYSFRREVVGAIRDAGYEVTISVPKGNQSKTDFFESIGCQIEVTDFNRRGTNPINDVRLLMRYCRILRRLKPKVVLTYTIKPNIYGGIAARMFRVPQLANITGLGDAVENGGLLQKLTILLYRVGLNKASKVFFQNTKNKEFCITAKIVNGNSELLPGSGVNLKHHSYQIYPMDEGKNRFLFIGRLLRDKGIVEYFEAAKIVKSKYSNTEFQVLGEVEGPYHHQLDDFVQSGIIHYLGSTGDVRPFIGSVECTVMPSYHEGMSNVNLESAANGRPVITTNVAGCRETVDDQITGYLVDVRDSQSLAETMERFILLPYEQKVHMGVAGRRKVEQEFDRQIVIESYLHAIQNV